MNNEMQILINGSKIGNALTPARNSASTLRMATLHRGARCGNCGVSVYMDDDVPKHQDTDLLECSNEREEGAALITPNEYTAQPVEVPLGWTQNIQTEVAASNDEERVTWTCTTTDGRYVQAHFIKIGDAYSVKIDRHNDESGTESETFAL